MDLMSVLKQAGFKGEGLKMAYAIAMAESSGNAKAHNPNASTGDNSYGLFQINMLGAMGPERMKQYGLSSYEDLFDPLTNAKVAFKMSNGGKNWGPWSTYNNGMYQSFYGQSGAKVGNSSGGYYAGSGYSSEGGVVVAKLSSKELAEQYGFVSSFLNSNKELKDLFALAVKEGMSPEKFQAKLKDTKWWKSTSKDQREWLLKVKSDPATAKQDLAQAKIKAKQIGNQLGIVESKFTLEKIANAAYNMVAKGWDESQIRYYLGQYVYFGKGKHQGEGGENFDQLQQYAYAMGVTMSGQWYADKSRNIVKGTASLQDYKSEILSKAKASFPQWSKQIDGGQSVADLAQPYLQSMTQILELPGGSVNLFDPTIKKALNYTNSKTLSREAKPLWQFENELRSDPRWAKTKNAQDSLMQVGHKVLADMGFVY